MPSVLCAFMDPVCSKTHPVPVPAHRGYEVVPRAIDLAMSIYVDTGIRGRRHAFDLGKCIKAMEHPIDGDAGESYRYTVFATDSVSVNFICSQVCIR